MELFNRKLLNITKYITKFLLYKLTLLILYSFANKYTSYKKNYTLFCMRHCLMNT